MDPTSHQAAPSSDLSAAADGGSGEPAGAAKASVDTGSGILPYLPTSRHRRPNDAELAGAGPLASARFIRATIVFTMLFVLAMTLLIWYRWHPVSLPSSSIEFVGNEFLDGTVATVSRTGQEPYTIKLDKQNNYDATIWLAAGRYELVVTTRDKLVLQHGSVDIAQMQALVDNVWAQPGAPHGPTTLPATHPGSGE